VISSSRGITYSYCFNEKDEMWRSISKEQMSKSIADSIIKAKIQINKVRFSTNRQKCGMSEKVLSELKTTSS